MDPKTIYVRNINFRSSSQALAKFFETYGKVKYAYILTEKYRGQSVSTGSGFIQFETEEGMKAALKASEDARANQKAIEFQGRNLYIRQARARPERKRDAAFVSGIPEGTAESDLLEAFKKYNATNAKIIRFNTESSRGFAFVKFATSEDQANAVKENKKIQIKGGESFVRYARRDYDVVPRRSTRRFRRGRRGFRRAPKQNQ
ncbi:RNA-binding protein [Histomonas meleagridis]|uniref:RNA-binding protein n=1 Tax=Histomonas meleagridis TaxID=135588 RepID=UPI00355A98CF|nr:RNA-binding protein [Histomonas meleagridis]KAH0804604.1 RNA-binding protein [Histomonas meleagridis]